MSVYTASVVRRHMKRSPMFLACEDTAQMPVPLALDPDERLVGWYKNPPPWEGEFIVFTTSAMYVSNSVGTTRICFDKIVDYDTPEDKKEATGVRVRMVDDDAFVRMAGHYGPDGKFRDVFNLVMILQVLISRRPPPA